MSQASQASTSRQPVEAVDRLKRTVDDLDRQVRDLRAQLAKERDARRKASERSRQKRRAASSGSLQELVAAWTGTDAGDDAVRDEVEVKKTLETRLSRLDDESLTALLTLSTSALVRLISGGETTASVLAIPTLLVPSKSVGIEGLGSGGEIDRRLAKVEGGDAATRKRKRPPLGIQVVRGGPDQDDEDERDVPGSDTVVEARQRAKQALWMNDWLEGRKVLNQRLLSHLADFTYLDISTLTQRTKPPSRAEAETDTTIRSVHLTGTLSDLCDLTLRYDVHEPASPSSSSSVDGTLASLASRSPQMRNLSLDMPPALRHALSANNHLARTLRQANLPALMLSLRTLLPLARLRQALYSNLAQRYPHLVPSSARNGKLWSPPPPVDGGDGSGKNKDKIRVQDADVLARLVDPGRAEQLVFTNARKASLELTFAITFTRHGHAYPSILLVPSLPAPLSSSTSTQTQTLLDSFAQRFQHLLSYLTSPQRRRDAAASLAANNDNDQEAAQQQRVGIQAAIVAVVDAFFAIESS
ncbi:uncharacterized protein PFL1_00534 [Pseudozyma flocculosa PF-1]|uniref:Uncharacterized protein n=1 Tax=Pseudozyma flocculosa TaxID=84751 RepID=A0A5C3ERH8_9BASI|nr:uncharacterized protein PFL1_00534 [Pseudozyma flocculosa PF-1]EPQ32338.1 hypothetical protein PFL1_00534 [Pseudozyma flocculosa PF-1]SPO34702.1 uncharacterized protein PSFLO_00173 [Pseudozyma flocculosa]